MKWRVEMRNVDVTDSSKKILGELLLDLGVITEAELVTTLTSKSKRTNEPLFGWFFSKFLRIDTKNYASIEAVGK